ncbi:Regulatory protein MsrR [compost metagenome]
MSIKKIFFSFLLLAIFSVFAAFGYYVYAFQSFSKIINHDSHTSTSLPEWQGEEPVNILLMGADTRDGEDAGRSDSIMLLHINPVNGQAYLFSILRDSWIKIPGHKSNRINTAFALGGPELMAQSVEKLTGLPIHYYLTTDFQGFEKVVDALGGIDLYVEKDMEYYLYENNGYYDIVLKQGQQHLDGRKALQYVRFRHDATGDYTRTERQRKFLKALAEKAKNGTTVFKVPKILEEISPYLTTNMDSHDMLRLASLAYKVQWSELNTGQIPPSSILKEKTIRGAKVIDPKIEKTKKYLQELLHIKSEDESL